MGLSKYKKLKRQGKKLIKKLNKQAQGTWKNSKKKKKKKSYNKKAWKSEENLIRLREKEKNRIKKEKLKQEMEKKYGMKSTDKLSGEYKDRNKIFGKKI